MFQRVILLLCIGLFLPSVSIAYDFPLNDLTAILSYDKENGVTFNPDLIDGTLDVIVDEEKADGAVSLYQDTGIINTNITQSQITEAPLTYALAIAYIDIDDILHYIYQNTSTDKLDTLDISLDVITNDDSGNTEKHPCLTFSFSRDDYNNMNKDNINAQELLNVGDLQPSDYCARTIANESDLSMPTHVSIIYSTIYTISSDSGE